MRRRREVEVLQDSHRARGLVNRVVAAFRHRAVRGHAGRARFEPQRALVSDERIIRRRLADQQRADAAEQVRLLREERRAAAAALLVRGQHERDAGRLPQPLGKRNRGDDECRNAAFHVARSTSVQPSAFEARAERVALPCSAPERHRVHVTGEPERWPIVVATDPSDDAGARRRKRRIVHIESGALQQLAEITRARFFRAGRIDRVERQQLLCQRNRVRIVIHRMAFNAKTAGAGARKWHATKCAGATSMSAGSSTWQRSNA